jgi:uncharacterized protein YPO0396
MMGDADLLDFTADDTHAGFRLQRMEVYNWGTFDRHVWTVPAGGMNTLLTGDIGSGKSTLVDAITTLLVPAGRVSYNKAAGAEFRERDLRSYVLGYYKSERGETGVSGRPVSLRDRHSYSVILGVFRNEGFDQTVTLAQVFHQKEVHGQPARFYVVADADLSIAEEFSGFGRELNRLRKRLRSLPSVEGIFDSFPPYGAAFRRRFGLQSEQALELFHQTVSMKAVGNLTGFVREHMLEAFDVSPRIEALIRHFDDLNRAHQAVLRAREQIRRLEPLVERLDEHEQAEQARAHWQYCRDGLRVHFASLKQELIDRRLASIAGDRERAQARLESRSSALSRMRGERDSLKQAIAENGGDRIESLRAERERAEADRTRAAGWYRSYEELCEQLELAPAGSAESFAQLRAEAQRRLSQLDEQADSLHAERSEAEVEFRRLRDEHKALETEIESLKGRKSNIDAQQVTLRERICEATGIEEERLPFAGELISVREDAKEWEGAFERLLRNFGLSLLVPADLYATVSEWVDRTHLRGRLVYYRVGDASHGELPDVDAASMVHRLSVRPDHDLSHWVERELRHRFDYLCAESMNEFRRASRAITRSGQIKGAGNRHEKDDRHRIDDRSRYILGWRNDEKIRTLNAQLEEKEAEIADYAERISTVQKRLSGLQEQRDLLYQLRAFERFEDLNWRPYAERIQAIDEEIASLERDSDILGRLRGQLEELETNITKEEAAVSDLTSEIARYDDRRQQAEQLRQETEETIAASEESLEALAAAIEPLREEALGEHRLTVESCDNRQTDVREWIQARLDAEAKRISGLRERILTAMQDFRREYQAETTEIDASIDAGPEYRAILARLQADDLPKFENRFKSLLNENTIREIANFQAQLNKECEIIRERVERINHSMSAIEFNRDRYIRLEVMNSSDAEIRSFRQELKSCTEGSFTGSRDEQYTEEKFLQVKAIIDRFKGREGTADSDRRWTEKVTDVRNWFTFAASERWKHDDTEHEHYTDSGGKSGGQKEKLAYTVLAASLAYQFGIEFGEVRSRSFRFVVIDEAFGKGSDESTRYGLDLFSRLNLQLLIVTPLQKIHIIEPYVSTVGFVHTEEGKYSLLRCMSIEEYREELAARRGHRQERASATGDAHREPDTASNA